MMLYGAMYVRYVCAMSGACLMYDDDDDVAMSYGVRCVDVMDVCTVRDRQVSCTDDSQCDDVSRRCTTVCTTMYDDGMYDDGTGDRCATMYRRDVRQVCTTGATDVPVRDETVRGATV